MMSQLCYSALLSTIIVLPFFVEYVEIDMSNMYGRIIYIVAKRIFNLLHISHYMIRNILLFPEF
jgi:hypothetical protein